MIACANLAGVQLARAFGRSHEFAVRSALGARRVHLMAPLLVESVLLTLAGGILGILLSSWTNRLVSRHFLPRGYEVDIDRRVLAFAVVASAVTALTFGFAPAWLASRVSTGDALKETSRASTSSRSQRRLKFVLVVGQLALALVLVSSALSFGIAVKSFYKRDLGWQPKGLVSGILNIPYEIYKKDLDHPVLVPRILERLSQIPG